MKRLSEFSNLCSNTKRKGFQDSQICSKEKNSGLSNLSSNTKRKGFQGSQICSNTKIKAFSALKSLLKHCKNLMHLE